MAKITKLSHIYPKDIRAMSLLAKSGAISKDTLNKMNISNNRIKSYRQAGLIKEVYVPDKHGSTGRYFYELTDKQGKEFCRTHCDIKNFISNGNASVHNAKVSEYLANNLSKNELDSCMSEAELILHFFGKDVSICKDCGSKVEILPRMSRRSAALYIRGMPALE